MNAWLIVSIGVLVLIIVFLGPTIVDFFLHPDDYSQK